MLYAYLLTLYAIGSLILWCINEHRISTPSWEMARNYLILSVALLFAFIVWSALAFKYHAELVALIPYCR